MAGDPETLVTGSLTLLGPLANLIVTESASRRRIDLSLWQVTNSGLNITLFSPRIALLWPSRVTS